jgi:hypothetical protein
MSKSNEGLASVPNTTTALAPVRSALTLPGEHTVRMARHRQASEDIAALIVAEERGAVTVCFRGKTLRPADVLSGLKKRAAKEANAWLDAMADIDDGESK